MSTLLQVENLQRRFGGGYTLLRQPKPVLHAVQGVEFSLFPGETLGIVGESGCGKSTLARMLVGLDRPSGGRISLDEEEISSWDTHQLARHLQYVFQDPVSSLNPRKTIRQILEMPMVHLLGKSRPARAQALGELMDAVSLRAEFLDRYPHEFSGGQAQRIGIARALAAEPRIIVLDEPVSALDVSVQAQVLTLLASLKARFGLTYVLISHDLAVVESVSDRVAVMYFGRIVELGHSTSLFAAPRHPYTRLLFDSAPVPGQRRVRDEEKAVELPDPYRPPEGCPFAPRCGRVMERCRVELPSLRELQEGGWVACHNPEPFLTGGTSEPVGMSPP